MRQISFSQMVKKRLLTALLPTLVLLGVVNVSIYIFFQSAMRNLVVEKKVASAHEQVLRMLQEANGVLSKRLDVMTDYTQAVAELIEKSGEDTVQDEELLLKVVQGVESRKPWEWDVGFLVIDPSGICRLSTHTKGIVGLDFSKITVGRTDFVSAVKNSIRSRGTAQGRVFEVDSRRLTYVIYRSVFQDFILGTVFYFPQDLVRRHLSEFLKPDRYVLKQGVYTSTRQKPLDDFEEFPERLEKTIHYEDIVSELNIDFPELGQHILLWLRVRYSDFLLHSILALLIFTAFSLLIFWMDLSTFKFIGNELRVVGRMIEEFKNNLTISSDFEKSGILEIADVQETLVDAASIISADVQELEALNEEVQDNYNRIQELSNQLKNAFYDFTQRLVDLVESLESETGEHVNRTRALVRLFVEDMGLEEEFGEQIVNFSALHDIGKIYVPKEILLKPGKLTPEEFEEVKKHTVYAKRLLSHPFFRVALNIAMYHHENYDGTGYPEGLKGEDIPIEARIVKLVDVYDALRSERPYKRAMSHEEAVKIILEGDGRVEPSHFDPRLLEIFRTKLEMLREIYENR